MPNATEQRKYELMVILSGEIHEGDVAKELDEIRKVLKDVTGGISHEDVWGKKEFAYRLKRQNRGYYAVFNFTAGPEAIAELRPVIKLNPAVLRHMLISVPEDYVPGRHVKEEIPERAREGIRPLHRKPFAAPAPARAPARDAVKSVLSETEKPRVAGKEEEEKLKSVEKKLEEILDNPDINIK